MCENDLIQFWLWTLHLACFDSLFYVLVIFCRRWIFNRMTVAGLDLEITDSILEGDSKLVELIAGVHLSCSSPLALLSISIFLLYASNCVLYMQELVRFLLCQ